MKESHSQALIISYYLSKFDKQAYSSLGFSSSTEANKHIGEILGVNPNSVKNMRDEFDPIHDNPRVGWYQRPLRPSRAKVVEAFQELSEEELRDVVLEILTNPSFVNTQDFADITRPITSRKGKRASKGVFILRGPTGRKAEEAFEKYHASSSQPIPGELHDVRELGRGYDYEIITDTGKAMVEVKGIDGDTGGILFTSKEWDIAKKEGNQYYLVIVKNVSDHPIIRVVKNPANLLNPQKSIYTTVQVRWSVTDKELQKAEVIRRQNEQ